MNIYLLLSGIILCLCVEFLLGKKDLMRPSILLTSGYLIACVSCILNIEVWGVDLKSNTCLLIIIGILSFLIGDLFSITMCNNRPLSAKEMTETTNIYISNLVILVFSMINIIILFLSIMDMINVTGGWRMSVGQTVGAFREMYSYTDAKTSTVVVQLLKFSKGSAYAFLYIFVNNIMAISKSKRNKIIVNLKYLFPTLIYLITTFLRGGRINFVMILVTCLFLAYFFWHRKMGWNKTISFSYIKKIALAFAIFAITFYLIRGFVGRQSEAKFVDYLTAYLGGSFQLLDQYLNSGRIINSGLETFPGILQSLEKLGIIKTIIHKSLEFRSTSTGIYLGNIYTGLRRYYHDFGYLGVVIIQIIYGILFGTMYNSIKQKKSMNSRRAFFVTTYGSLLFCIISQAMEDHFWIDLGLGFFVELFVMYFMFKLIFDVKISKGLLIKIGSWREY